MEENKNTGSEQDKEPFMDDVPSFMEKPADENSTAAQKPLNDLNDLNDSNDPNDTMEVHHHAHDPAAPHHKKNWKSYFWEFLMLFLAVFCGFLAEYQLEHKIERDRAKQYIYSIVEDLKLDIKNLDSIGGRRKYRAVMIDSLTQMLSSPNPDQYGREIYYYARWLTYFYLFINNDRTIQQLKNSGNFRLINNQEVSDRIMNYDQQVRWIDPTNKREEIFIENYVFQLGELFDSHVFDGMMDPKYGFHRPAGNPKLLNKEKARLQKISSSLHFLKSINIFIMTWLTNQRNRALSILEFIKKEYHLK